ncbi:MAG TPA: cytochrome b/b6 domain-containing protein, partial [Janthinobacterium sp.]|nr:cytochrome b/b6 domain-containing protein [Janthinobacterium sp.]
MQTKTSSRYGALSQAFHWLTAILVLVAFIYGPGGSEERVYLPQADAGRHLHETLGICILVLAVLRLLWRSVAARPEPPEVARWMGAVATMLQYGLYLLLFALPLTAMLGAWLEGHPLTLLWGLQISPPFSASRSLGATLAEVHGWLGDIIMWLAGLHAIA